MAKRYLAFALLVIQNFQNINRLGPDLPTVYVDLSLGPQGPRGLQQTAARIESETAITTSSSRRRRPNIQSFAPFLSHNDGLLRLHQDEDGCHIGGQENARPRIQC